MLTTSEAYEGDCSICGHHGLVVKVIGIWEYIQCLDAAACWYRWIEWRREKDRKPT